ncbi:hypothetical protein D0T51_11600 [Parabacteroides sp. 52]|uniref:hypothetical protein n=1 Tax=unclassified Parabacteroides TaxID=2649774 RepID=UPI0013D6E108|nr:MULTISPECIES: hypothetical protein [unclassified Parabacteroides]MDH6535752.1 hypothetical protein [Parabacteroides sp. PM5-20]NDV56369.1 hypothetical protein [Parabacteroides sp. 52]
MKRANYTPEALSYKQYDQLINEARRVQSVLPYEEVTLLEFIKIAIEAADLPYGMEGFKGKLDVFKKKYYPYGVKRNKKLSAANWVTLRRCGSPRYYIDSFPRPYNPVEKIAFVKTIRAYRDYFDAQMTEQAFGKLFEEIGDIRILLKEIY